MRTCVSDQIGIVWYDDSKMTREKGKKYRDMKIQNQFERLKYIPENRLRSSLIAMVRWMSLYTGQKTIVLQQR